MTSLKKVATTVTLLSSVALLVGGCSKSTPPTEVPSGTDAEGAEGAEGAEQEDPYPADADADVTDPDPE